MPGSPPPWVPDSSVLSSYLGFGRYREFLLTGLKRGTVFVPGVVLCELHAGASSRENRADLEALRRALGAHLLGAGAEEWVLTGRCLSDYRGRWGKMRPRDHLADVLVAVSALTVGAVLVSEDVEQMRRWSGVLGRLGHRLKVQGAEHLV